MTRILTALTFAIALGLSMTTASADGGYLESGTSAALDPAWPVPNVGYQRK